MKRNQKNKPIRNTSNWSSSKAIFVLIFLIILTSCSKEGSTPKKSSPVVNPADQNLAVISIPQFPGVVRGLKSIPNGYLLDSDQICLDIESSHFWEIGDFWYTLDDLPSIKIEIDSHAIEPLYRSMSSLPIPKFDQQGTQIGLHTEYMTFCVMQPQLQLQGDSHSIYIEITTTSGKKYSYSWEFYINKNFS